MAGLIFFSVLVMLLSETRVQILRPCGLSLEIKIEKAGIPPAKPPSINQSQTLPAPSLLLLSSQGVSPSPGFGCNCSS